MELQVSQEAPKALAPNKLPDSNEQKSVAILVEDYFSLANAAKRREKAKKTFELIDRDEVDGKCYFDQNPNLRTVLIGEAQDAEAALRSALHGNVTYERKSPRKCPEGLQTP